MSSPIFTRSIDLTMQYRLKALFIGWLSGLGTVAIVGAVALLLVLSGILFNTSARQPHSEAVAWVVHRTMIASVARRSRNEVPRLPFDRKTLLAGMRNYETHCIACHGGPGAARAAWVSAMLPTPPYLLDSSGRWTHAELFTLVHDGVKMTGMPAWGEIQSDRQIAEVVALLEAMPKLTPAQFAKLRQLARADQGVSSVPR
jgi:mono/diheme cytochrome c family protein